MFWFETFIKYWAQVGVLLAGIGYVLSVIFNYRYKKREIFFSLYAKNKIDCFIQFCELYYDASNILMDAFSKYAIVPDKSYVLKIKAAQEKLFAAGFKLHLFLDKKTASKCQTVVHQYMQISDLYIDVVNRDGKFPPDIIRRLQNEHGENLAFLAKSAKTFKRGFYNA